MRIAVIGAGIAGLACAHALVRQARASGAFDPHVTVYEAASRLGGHTNTVDVALDGLTYPVDTGFLVFNRRTYPHLLQLFADLDVPIAASDMSFSVSVPVRGAFGGRRLEWSGANLDTVFAQRRNLGSPDFLRMLMDLLRFNAQATRIACGSESGGDLSLGAFLDRHGYGAAFRDWYLLPMAAAIWSCPMSTMLGYPVATFVRFCHNHGLLQVNDRPQWFTVQGGARQYVERIAAQLPDVRSDDPVHTVTRASAGKVLVESRHGRLLYDEVVLACHSDQSLRLLRDADRDERAVLEAVPYQPNRAVLHTDPRLMPNNRKVWAAWNYLSAGGPATAPAGVSVTYLLNKLQPLPFKTPVFLSLNPLQQPRPDKTIAEFDYTHPVFDARATDAQRRLPFIQGRRFVWFAGAWTGYGFHEDGLKSGLGVAATLTALATRPVRLAA
jgi:predicted NAD/FAD-binding protein